MQKITITELRTHAKQYFDTIEKDETLRVYRNGKPVADVVPLLSSSIASSAAPSWKRPVTQLGIKDFSLSREILRDRDISA